MAFIVLYPAVAVLTMFVVGVIIVMLKYGPRLCKVRHTTLANPQEWNEQVYEQSISRA